MRNSYDITPGADYFKSDAAAKRRKLGIKDYQEKQAEKYTRWLDDMASGGALDRVPQSTGFPVSTGGGDGVGWFGVFVMLFIPPLTAVALFIIFVYLLHCWMARKKLDKFKPKRQKPVRAPRRKTLTTEPIFRIQDYEAPPAPDEASGTAVTAMAQTKCVTRGSIDVGLRLSAYTAANDGEAWSPLADDLPTQSLLRHTTLYQARRAATAVA
jgi:hypothetical protein